jgi:hypothetical protein
MTNSINVFHHSSPPKKKKKKKKKRAFLRKRVELPYSSAQ